MIRRGTGLLVAVLLAVLAPWAQAQPVPLHEQEREWVNVFPDTLKEARVRMVQVGYSSGQRVIYASLAYRPPDMEHYVSQLIRSTDDGKTWTVIYDEADAARYGWEHWGILRVSAWAQDANVLYATTDVQLLKSTDGGETWQDLTGTIVPEHVRVFDPQRVEISPFDSSRVVVADGGSSAWTFASEDGGRSWRAREWGGGSHGAEIGVLASPIDSLTALAWGTLRGTGSWPFVMRTDDWGASHQTMSRQHSLGERIDDVHVDGKGIYYASSGNHGVHWISRDGGDTWEETEGAYLVRGVATEGALAIATWADRPPYYVSYDRGRSWTELAQQPPSLSNDLLVSTNMHALDGRDSTLFVASARGLWAHARLGTVGTAAEEEPAAVEALRLEAYPNPARERATVTYALPMAGPVRLIVYDVLGREVAVLVDERQPAGEHRAHFEAARLPAGTYFVRLLAPEGEQTQPVVVR